MPEQQPLLMTNQPQQPHAEKAKVKIDLKSTSKKSVDFANNNNHQISSDHVQQPHQQPTSQTPTNSSSRDLSQVSTSLCFTYFWAFFLAFQKAKSSFMGSFEGQNSVRVII